MKRNTLTKMLLTLLGFGVGVCIVWAATTPTGTVNSVSPCNTTVSGNVTVSHSGKVEVTGSGEPAEWQFLLETWSMYGCNTDCSISDDYTVLESGEWKEYTLYVVYSSTTKPNGTHTSWGRNSSRPYGSPGGYDKRDEKHCNYTVDN